MTIKAENFEVADEVIAPVAINVVHTEWLCCFRVIIKDSYVSWRCSTIMVIERVEFIAFGNHSSFCVLDINKKSYVIGFPFMAHMTLPFTARMHRHSTNS